MKCKGDQNVDALVVTNSALAENHFPVPVFVDAAYQPSAPASSEAHDFAAFGGEVP